VVVKSNPRRSQLHVEAFLNVFKNTLDSPASPGVPYKS
jgi:hypothetical protein